MKNAPTKSGASFGVDSASGVSWSFEPADEHWRLHDVREAAYWRSRPAEERLAQAARYRVRAVDGRYGAVPVRFIGLGDLLANKRAAGRPKDLADVAALERQGL